MQEDLQPFPAPVESPFSSSTDLLAAKRPKPNLLIRFFSWIVKACLCWLIEHISILLVLGGAIGLGGSLVFDTMGRLALNSFEGVGLTILLVLVWLTVIVWAILLVGSLGQYLSDRCDTSFE